MKLYLAQHGHAVAKSENPDRPLSEQGRQDVQQLATRLGHAGVKVRRTWHSGKLRAVETASLLARYIQPAGKPQAIKGIKPNDPVAEFASDADVWDEDTLVVGHLPFVSRLVSLLLTADPETELLQFTPGTLVCLQRVQPDHWIINWMWSPELNEGEI